jgi:sec-independent protein translocase protein TatC
VPETSRLTGAIRSVARLFKGGRSPNSVDDSRMTLTEHLQELRARLLKSLLALMLITIVVGIWLYHPIFNLLVHPYCHLPEDKRALKGSCQLIFTSPTDAFTIRLKVAFIGGAILSMPIWLYQIWAFITPGLHRHERRWGLYFIVASLGLFAIGSTIAYLILPKALEVLLGFGGKDLAALLAVNEYLSFIIHLLLIFGISFEFPLVLVMLNMAGVLSSERLRHWRRMSYFLIAAFAAVATPTQDPITMTAMMIPLWILFEIAVLITWLHDRRKARRDEQSEYAHLDDDETSPLHFAGREDLDDERDLTSTGAGQQDSDIT